MGWYLRKSLRLGPVRFNLSKSGIGTSIGVRGLRIGTGPKGPYLHAGRDGLYFREQLGHGTNELSSDEDRAPVQEQPAKDGLMRLIKRLFLRQD
jgi:hypothetical protein